MQAKALVVDDQEETRSSIKSLLEENNCLVMESSDLDDAVDLISANPDLNLLVTDINLRDRVDDLSGVSLGRMSKQLREDMPVAGYSSSVETNRFTIASNRIFDIFLDTSNATAKDYSDFALECAVQATRHRNDTSAHLSKLRPELRLSEHGQRLDKIELALKTGAEKYVTQDRVLTIVLGAAAIVGTLIGTVWLFSG